MGPPKALAVVALLALPLPNGIAQTGSPPLPGEEIVERASPAAPSGQDADPSAVLPTYEGRIVTAQEVKNATRPAALLPLRILSFPHRRISAGMEKGLMSFEQHHMWERWQLWQEHLRRHLVEPHFGGVGEGTGLGGGVSFAARTGERQYLKFLGLATFKAYQEFDAQWAWEVRNSKLVAEGSYQWRPQENFYGLGHSSLKEKHSNFALRQTWTGLRWEMQPVKRLRWGAVYKLAWISALPGQAPGISSPNVFFFSLPGYGTQARLQSVGAYVETDLFRGEYSWGGLAHFGTSYQEGWGASKLRYFSSETQLEGRLPIASGRSALVGQANFELNRERAGSDPIPFYLLPHIGGSSTLRGFALDRFYGRNLALLSLEYRYKVHPNIQAIPFFDEGQIFDRHSDLSWLNWHRNYGMGFRFRSARGTFVRLEYGHSSEGFQLHILFGDRERPPLRGPIRYGAYKR